MRLRGASARCGRLISAARIWAAVRSAPERFAPDRSERFRIALDRFAFERSAPDRSARYRSAPRRSAPDKFAFDKSAPANLAFNRFCPERSPPAHPVRGFISQSRMVCCVEPTLAVAKIKAKRAKPPYVNARIFINSYRCGGLVLVKFTNSVGDRISRVQT